MTYRLRATAVNSPCLWQEHPDQLTVLQPSISQDPLVLPPLVVSFSLAPFKCLLQSLSCLRINPLLLGLPAVYFLKYLVRVLVTFKIVGTHVFFLFFPHAKDVRGFLGDPEFFTMLL